MFLNPYVIVEMKNYISIQLHFMSNWKVNFQSIQPKTGSLYCKVTARNYSCKPCWYGIFTSLFQVILTDRGSEFTNPLAIEFNKSEERRTHIFYCDPQRSDQKGGCEVTHEMIRRVLPKGTSFDELDQNDINLMMSNINSYNRKKLNNQSAHQLFSFLNNAEILNTLNIKSIPANEINLTPLLLKK